uniref:17S U2 SnRNP complex component HTATSF1 n=1 Tax=Parasteatoda tepidariorum TaxID=114398 RepID=A0A2L2YJE2_PARTP
MANQEFEAQLELEKLEKTKKELTEEGVTDPYTYISPDDGTVYEWNQEKQAWFPKVNDDDIARYHQLSYNYVNTEEESKPEEKLEENKPKGEKRKPSDPSWFQVDDDHNTNVYVSGLPDDIKDEEFIELMSKCGLIMKDPHTMKYKIKLYRDSNGVPKGDGRCCYIKIESVKLALDILDGYDFKGKKIHVERAQFELKGQYDPSKKPKKMKAKEKEKLKKKIDKLFEWKFEKLRGERSKNEKTVILKNMFSPKEFDEDATLLLDYQQDIREECSKCGEVKKVVIYDRNPEGVVAVTFAEPEMADECINLMNRRWFASRQLTAETWDGKTKYKITETKEELEKRLNSWDKFLEEPSSANKSDAKETPPAEVASKAGEVNISSKDYELAGETDSSGDSETEDKTTPQSKESYPVMLSNGGLSFKNVDQNKTGL